MLIDLKDTLRRNGVKPTGILHVGAHLAEELKDYRAVDRFMPVWWVEGNPELAVNLNHATSRFSNHHVIATLVGAEVTETTLHVANHSMSSSVLPLGTHKEVHPWVHYDHDVTAPMTTIDALTAEHAVAANVLVLDIQGGEGAALEGGQTFLEGVDVVYSEVNQRELYQGCLLLPDMDRWLNDRGFEMRALIMEGATGWGDAVWVRT